MQVVPAGCSWTAVLQLRTDSGYAGGLHHSYATCSSTPLAGKRVTRLVTHLDNIFYGWTRRCLYFFWLGLVTRRRGYRLPVVHAATFGVVWVLRTGIHATVTLTRFRPVQHHIATHIRLCPLRTDRPQTTPLPPYYPPF